MAWTEKSACPEVARPFKPIKNGVTYRKLGAFEASDGTLVYRTDVLAVIKGGMAKQFTVDSSNDRMSAKSLRVLRRAAWKYYNLNR